MLRVLFILAISFYLFTLVSNFQEHVCLNPDLILDLISFSAKEIEPQLLLFCSQWWTVVSIYWSALWSWQLQIGEAESFSTAVRLEEAGLSLLSMNVQFSSS